MLESDKKEFAAIIRSTLKMYRADHDADVLRLWWGVLQRFDLDVVRDAFGRFLSEAKNNSFPPVPANIIGIIESMRPDGRVGADEAWAMFPHDESTSAVITNEMSEAMGIASPLMNEGDKIGARMAFKDAYNRIVARNKMSGIAPTWFPSLGTDKGGREQALIAAVEKGRITHEFAQSILPSGTNALQQFIPELQKLTDKTADADYAKKRIAEIRAMLEK